MSLRIPDALRQRVRDRANDKSTRPRRVVPGKPGKHSVPVVSAPQAPGRVLSANEPAALDPVMVPGPVRVFTEEEKAALAVQMQAKQPLGLKPTPGRRPIDWGGFKKRGR